MITFQIWREELWRDPLRGWAPAVCGRGAVCGHQPRLWRGQRWDQQYRDFILLIESNMFWAWPKAEPLAWLLLKSKANNKDWNINWVKKEEVLKCINMICCRKGFFMFLNVLQKFDTSKFWNSPGIISKLENVNPNFSLERLSLLDIYARNILKCWNFPSWFKVDLCQPENMWHFKGWMPLLL